MGDKYTEASLIADLKSQLAQRDEPCVCGHTESLTGMAVLYVLDYCTKCGHKIEVKSDEAKPQG